MSSLSRRRVLRIGTGVAASVGLLGAGAGLPAAASPRDAGPAAGPDDALRRLLAGNRRWARDRVEHPHQSVHRRRQVTAGQSPFALVLSCADSRVPPEVVFDCGIGDLLVVRTPGQALDPLVVGSVEFGVAELEIPLVFVLGHERCGAVITTVEAIERHGGHAPAHIQRLVDALRPAYNAARERPGDLVENVVRAQIQLGVARLRRDELLAPLLTRRAVAVVGGRYDLDSGAVTLTQ